MSSARSHAPLVDVAPDEFVSEYSVPRIIAQYQGLLLSTKDYCSVPGIITQYQGLLLSTRDYYSVPGIMQISIFFRTRLVELD